MGFAQHFFRNSNFPKNKFAPVGVSGGVIHRLGETRCKKSTANNIDTKYDTIYNVTRRYYT